MSVTASWGASNYLEVASAAGATRPFLDHGWGYIATLGTGTMISSGVANNSLANNVCQTGFQDASTWRARWTDNAGSGSNVSPSNGPTAGQWMSLASAYIATTHGESWVDGDIVNKGKNDATTARDQTGTIAYTRVGCRFDGSNAANYLWAEITRWDITGFTETNRDDLITRLTTLVGGQIPNPLTVNEDSAEAWTGKLVRYWPLTDNSDLADASGVSSDTFTATGTVSTGGSHPNVASYNAATTVAAGLGAITVAGQAPITYIPPRRMTLDVRIL